jgi:ab-hydrolase associated lipase region.
MHGYPVEVHTVISDGYILTLHRIPRGRKSTEKMSFRPAVIIHHALLCSSFDWVVLGPEKALGK